MKKIKRPRSTTSAKSPQGRNARPARRTRESEHFKSLVALERALQIIKGILEHLAIDQTPHPKLSTVLNRRRQPRAHTFEEQLDDLEEAYMVSGPPMSPITHDIFWYWAMFDVKHTPKGEPLVHQVSKTLPEPIPELTAYMGPLQDSHFGIYICEGHRLSTEEEVDYYDLSGRRPHLFLRELVTGRRVNAILKELLVFPPGQALMLRLVELQRPTHVSGDGFETLYASLCTPYILNEPEEEWTSYFNRSLPKDQRRREASYLRLMRSERGLLLWLEYIQAAYHGDTKRHDPHLDLAIYLSGVPDRLESLPHGDMASVNLLTTKR